MFGSQRKGLEYFPKADFISLGWADQGITWETDPVKHRQKVKWLLPAFSAKSFKTKEPVIHKYIDIFVEKMRKLGGKEEGIELRQVSVNSIVLSSTLAHDLIVPLKWADWLAMDIAADLGYSREMNQLKERKSMLA